MDSRDRLMDLLIVAATEGLAAEQSRELARAFLEQTNPRLDDLELAAAAIHLAYEAARTETEPMPAALKQRIVAQATSEGSMD